MNFCRYKYWSLKNLTLVFLTYFPYRYCSIVLRTQPFFGLALAVFNRHMNTVGLLIHAFIIVLYDRLHKSRRITQPALKPHFKFDIEEEQGADDSTVQQEVRFSTKSCEVGFPHQSCFLWGRAYWKPKAKVFII